MKTKEELNELKEEVETLNRKLHELTEEETEQIYGGGSITWACGICHEVFYNQLDAYNHRMTAHNGGSEET